MLTAINVINLIFNLQDNKGKAWLLEKEYYQKMNTGTEWNPHLHFWEEAGKPAVAEGILASCYIEEGYVFIIICG